MQVALARMLVDAAEAELAGEYQPGQVVTVSAPGQPGQEAAIAEADLARWCATAEHPGFRGWGLGAWDCHHVCSAGQEATIAEADPTPWCATAACSSALPFLGSLCGRVAQRLDAQGLLAPRGAGLGPVSSACPLLGCVEQELRTGARKRREHLQHEPCQAVPAQARRCRRPPVYAITIRGQTLDNVPEKFLTAVQQERSDLMPPGESVPPVEAPQDETQDSRCCPGAGGPTQLQVPASGAALLVQLLRLSAMQGLAGSCRW